MQKFSPWFIFYFCSLVCTAQYEVQFEKAKQLKEDGLYDSAANSFEILISDPGALPLEKQLNTMNWWGLSLLNAAIFEKADSVLLNAIEMNKKETRVDSILLADSYFFQSKNSGSSHRFSISVEQVNTALAIWDLLDDQDSLIACGMNMLGYDYRYLGDYPGALAVYQKARDTWDNHPEMAGPESANTSAGFGWVYTAMGDYIRAIEEHMKALKIREELFDPDHPYIANSETSLGGVYLRLTRYDKSEYFYKRALDKLKVKLGESHPNVISLYSRLGTIYYQLGDFEKSIEFHQQAIRTWHQERKLSSLFLVQFYGELAKSIQAHGDLEGALINLNEAFKYAEGYGRTLYLFNLLQVKAQVLEQLYRYDEWLSTLTETQELIEKQLAPDHPAMSTIQTHFGRYYLKTGEYQKSGETVLSALEHNLKIRGEYHTTTHHQYLLLGDLNRDLNQYRDALKFYQKSLRSLWVDPSVKTSYPEPDQISSLRLAISAVERIGDAYLLLEKESAEDKNALLESSLEANLKGLEYLDFMRDRFSGEEAKSRMLEISQPLFWGAVEACYGLYQQADSIRYLKRALDIVEKGRAFNLVNAINNHRAKKFAGVPPEVIEAEIGIRTALNHVRTRLQSSRVKGNPELEQQVQQQFFDLKQQKDSLYQLVATLYPKYSEFQHEGSKIELQDIQRKLGDDEVILEYFITKKHVHVFMISRDQLKWHASDKPETLQKMVNNLRSVTTDHDLIMESPIWADSVFLQSGRKLYEVLLEKPLSGIPDKITDITLIPDDIMWQLQFGILPAKPVDDDNFSYKTYPYLLRNYNLSYAYALHFLQSVEKSSTGKGLIAFAPIYEPDPGNGSSLEPLMGAVREVGLIHDIISGAVIKSGPEASKVSFMENAGDYRIVHLAMHGIIDDAKPLNTRLVFSSLEDQDGNLFLPEIYGLQLKADLVVLSACNSGVGRVQKGEGNQSLSRAFNYAGVPSVVMSMWKVPDNITADLMRDFYLNLKSGENKSRALVRAQLSYLEKQDDPLFSHPFYWSAFIMTGRDDPVQLGRFNSLILISTLLALTLGLIVMWKRRN